MAGEKSKKTGEYGENIVAKIMTRIGWRSNNHSIDIPCLHPKRHQRKDSQKERSSHGIDFLVYLKDHLMDDTQNTVVVSGKYREKYPASPNATFKPFLEEVHQAIECVKDNDQWGSTVLGSDITTINYPGVIFWLTQGDEKDSDIIDQITDLRQDYDSRYPVYLVDNRRANFLLESLDFVHALYPSSKVEFVYPTTGRNLLPGNSTSGPQLPLQFINSSMIPIKVFTGGKEILVLTSIEDYDPDTFASTVGMAKNLTHGWGTEAVICYPKFHDLIDGDSVNRVLERFDDRDFADKVRVKSYRPDHTSLGGNDIE